MKNRIKSVALAGLLSAFCLIPPSNAQAHETYRWEKTHTRGHHTYKQRTMINKHNGHNTRHYKKDRYVRQTYYSPGRKVIVKKVIIQKPAPQRFVYNHKYNHKYSYKSRNDRDILAIALAQTAIALALD